MNLKAKTKQLQGVKNVRLQIAIPRGTKLIAIPRGTNSNSLGYTYMYVLPSVGIHSTFYVNLSILFSTMSQNLVVINGNCCFCMIRLMMYHQQ